MNELAAMRLLGIVRSSGGVTHPGQTIAGLENFGAFGVQLDLRTVTLTPMGRRLHRLMQLDGMPDAELRSILSDLFRGP